ncbi:MAG: 2-oxoacid:acceptor oxidoreductase family protein [Alphaproteobacteria bacterium]
MIRVRFHGRGGQGMKTASRMVGTAAFLAGFVARDSQVYGAERRGAPMAAFTRIGKEPIFERGVIATPDLVVVADDTLLDDPVAKPLAGLQAAGALVVATAHSTDDVRYHTGHCGPIVAGDFLALALEDVGSVAGVSTALASAVCALLGLSRGATAEGLRAELTAIGVDPATMSANLRLAERARVGIGPILLPAPAVPWRRTGSRVVDLTYEAPEIGTPTVTAEPNTPLRRTGSWRVFRPVIEPDKCTQCWVCFVWCPEGAIELDAEDNPHVDYGVCKGCLICVEECPTRAIAKVREVHEWMHPEVTV